MQTASPGLEIPLYIKAFNSVGYCGMILNLKLIGLKMKDLINYTVIEKIKLKNECQKKFHIFHNFTDWLGYFSICFPTALMRLRSAGSSAGEKVHVASLTHLLVVLRLARVPLFSSVYPLILQKLDRPTQLPDTAVPGQHSRRAEAEAIYLMRPRL